MEQISAHPFFFALEIDLAALGLNLKGNADVQKRQLLININISNKQHHQHPPEGGGGHCGI